MNIILETDQKFCFDELGNQIGCRNTLQDAEYERSNSDMPPRFAVGNDSVEDRLTGLIWHKNANLFGFPLSWKEAFNFIQELNNSKASNISNWRLPSRGELFSLVSHQQINPSLPDTHQFENVFNGYYWTQTECARLPDQAWYVHFGGGRVYRGMKHGSYMVWPVAGKKGGNNSAGVRFNEDGNLIFDSRTERIWLNDKKLNIDAATWKEAINCIKSLNSNRAAGFNDWRLPNIRELDSLVDTTQHSPAFAADCLFAATKDGYWSSTTSLYEPRYAWVLYPRDGAIGVGYKPGNDFYILPVRG